MKRKGHTMAPKSNVAPRRVLVVDDDPALLAAIADGLQIVGGFDVIFASDGASGLERFFAAAPDCVVVDVRMPGLNGYQFVRALRGDPETAQTPIIVLSALVQDREQLAGLLTGADAYLTKPVKIVDLVVSIDHAVRLTSDERQRRVRELTETAPERGDA
jgi:DNA-binding response OmpR family regulator